MSVTLGDLLTYARRRYHNKSDAEATAVLTAAINRAIRTIAKRDHPFYRQEGHINIAAPVETGSVTIAKGATTLAIGSGGAWATAHVGYAVKINDENVHFRIGAFVSAGACTLDTGQTWMYDSVAAVDYTLYQDRYDLPTDFRHAGEFIDDDLLSKVEVMDNVSEWFAWKMSHPGSTGEPYMACFAKDAFMIFPYMEEPKIIPYWYYRWPTTMASAASEMDFEEGAIDLVYAAIDYEVARDTMELTKKREAWDSFLEEEKRQGGPSYQQQTTIFTIGAPFRPARHKPYLVSGSTS